MRIPIPKKTRSDSRLDKLPLTQRNALLRWLAYDRLTYAQATARLASQYQVKTSATAVCRFYQRILERRMVERAVQVHLIDYAPRLHDALNPPRRMRPRRAKKPGESR